MAINYYTQNASGIMPEYFASLGNKLTQREILFVNNYVKTGNKKEAAIAAGWKDTNANYHATKILKKAPAQQYIARAQEKAAQKIGWEYEAKLKKLKQIAICAVPEKVTHENLNVKKASVAISAIAEANKMQGHYSAEKHVNVNVGMDIEKEEAKRLTQELMDKYRSEY